MGKGSSILKTIFNPKKTLEFSGNPLGIGGLSKDKDVAAVQGDQRAINDPAGVFHTAKDEKVLKAQSKIDFLSIGAKPKYASVEAERETAANLSSLNLERSVRRRKVASLLQTENRFNKQTLGG